ncbi:HAD family hydrolase [Allosalinactinospora lopnorensis]|uniref:HAD family hydrolase n=1 Tax=Allosalinactinospora lopnorensis TaxID=1352348 RepID=UPI0009E5244B|nr:HAD hydrolase-like protein [Allosalinactinospora lopnorensis]
MRSPLLILWDIDHTLIKTGGVGREIFGEAFAAATGQVMKDMPEATGHTEPDLFRETLAMHGIEEAPEYFSIFAKTQAEGYKRRAEELLRRGEILPGILEALDSLGRTPRVVQSVLSGNTRAAATAKLDIFGLSQSLELDIGAYGDDESHRPHLVSIAQKRAETKHGYPFSREETILIGDTVRDVYAGDQGGARVIAVATGRTSINQLRDARPETVLPDARDHTALLTALGIPFTDT